MGSQYEFLSRYCLQEVLDDVEMSVEDSPTGFLPKLIQPCVVSVNKDDYTYYKIDAKYEGKDGYTLFKYFSFPILFITKLDMQEIVIKEGFEELIEHTWFCHNPQKHGVNYEPCGVCHPCMDVMSAGMGRRMTLRSKTRYYFRVRSRVKKLSRRYPKFFPFVRKWKRKLLKK